MRGVRGDGPPMLTNTATHAGSSHVADETVAPTIVAQNVVIVESSAHAYSQIKRVQPNLVILCVRIDDADGFQVLSMLKLDGDTRAIPVLTYTTEFTGQEPDDQLTELSDTEIFT